MTSSHSYITPGRELKFDFLCTIFAAEPFYISTLNVIITVVRALFQWANRLRLKVVITFTFTSMFFKLIIKSPTHKITAKWDMGFREEKVEIISLQIVFLSYIPFTKMKIIPLIFRLLARVVQIFIYVPLHCLVINASNQFCFFKCLGQIWSI